LVCPYTIIVCTKKYQAKTRKGECPNIRRGLQGYKKKEENDSKPTEGQNGKLKRSPRLLIVVRDGRLVLLVGKKGA